MKKCELCKSVARLYCDSDEAILCWDCDSRVHAANFLAAKHSRTLLCNTCQAPTSWTGSGSKLGPAISACEACVDRRFRVVDNDRRIGNLNTVDGRSGGGIGEEQLQDDDGENQVVPPLLGSSSSRSEDQSNSRRDVASNSSTAGFSRTRSPAENPRMS